MAGSRKRQVSILHDLEKGTEPVDGPLLHHVSVIDGMALLQKVNVNGLTYGQLGNKILQMILSISCHADRIDVVYDTYNDISIKRESSVRDSSYQYRIYNLGTRLYISLRFR